MSGIIALTLVFIGVIFLLQNFGLLSWNVWQVLWRFWPLILITLGIDMLFGHTHFGRIITIVVTIAVIFLISYFLILGHTSLDFRLFSQSYHLQPNHRVMIPYRNNNDPI